MPVQAFCPDGKPVDLATAITPIFVKLENDLYRIIGTGFYIARYGLFLTAKHVVEDIAEHDAEGRSVFVWSWDLDGTLRIRPVLTCSFDLNAPRKAIDIAICQCVDRWDNGNMQILKPNERIGIYTGNIKCGINIATYAYPGNYKIDTKNVEKKMEVFADVFEGKILEEIGPNDRYLRYRHFETSMEIRSGSSGGPVFFQGGHAFAVNCRGWNLADSIEALSSVVPISQALDISLPIPLIPLTAWEYQTIPHNRHGGSVTLRDLAEWGHISIVQ